MKYSVAVAVSISVFGNLGAHTGASFDVAALLDPRLAQRRQTLLNCPLKRLVTPWPAAIINTHRVVRDTFTVEGLARRERDLAEWDSDVRETLAGHENLFGLGQRLAAMRFEGLEEER